MATKKTNHKNIKQMSYRPKKEKIVPSTPRHKATGEDVLNYFFDLMWDNKVFLLVTFIILENTLLLVRMK